MSYQLTRPIVRKVVDVPDGRPPFPAKEAAVEVLVTGTNTAAWFAQWPHALIGVARNRPVFRGLKNVIDAVVALRVHP